MPIWRHGQEATHGRVLQGFTFECDVKGRLTIEGNPVQVVAAPDDGVDLG
ncbi:MAG TPA: hypothetical protein VHX16_09065 [Chloroflexota bacterium]|nr:hypothetical protein [Chloroflexota bacterium]